MRQDEVLAAGLADEPRVAAVAREVGTDLAPQVLERRGRPGEVDAREVRVGERDLGDVEPVAGHEVDDARRHSGRLEQLHRQLGGEVLRRRRLPHDGVAHEGRCGRQVAGDGGEVERGDRVDEPLERSVVGAVPDALRVQRRLLGEDLPGEVHVDPPEVDELARRVDLGLVARLALAQHRRGVEPGAPRPGQQLGRLEQDGRAVVERERPPAGSRGLGRLDGGAGIGHRRVLQRAEDLAAGVRLPHVEPLAAAHHPTAADGMREVAPVGAQRRQRDLEVGPFGAARRILENRLVDRCGDLGHSVHGGCSSSGRADRRPLWFHVCRPPTAART